MWTEGVYAPRMPRSAGPAAHEPVSAPTRSPLLPAALALVPPSASTADLVARLEAEGAAVSTATAARLLHDLASLGLVRATRRDDDGPHFVVTSLGQRSLDTAIHGAAALPLEELERLRTDLLSTIAHELRTPLTAVRTSVGLLLDPASAPTEEQRRALLSAIERSGDRMQRLVDDILELSRFRAGRVTLQLRRFGAVALAESAIAVVAPLAATRGQRITLDVHVGTDHRVYGDRRRLEQALVNLVANAQRFSPDQGLIRVIIARRHDITAWTVEDDGPGIPDADQPRLFERFFVGRNDRAGSREGVGLGLPTALAIAQAHGGSIEVDSQVGRGSRFELLVPTAGPDEGPESEP